MKFAANKALEGKEIELKRVPEVSKPGNGGKRKTIRQMIEEMQVSILQIQQTLNLHTELFIEHSWLVKDPKTGKYVRPSEIK